MQVSPQFDQRLLMLIENEPAQSRMMETITSRAGWRSIVVLDAETALATLGNSEGMQLSAVVLDYGVAGEASCDLIAELKRRRPELPVLMLAPATSKVLSVEAMRAGASDFLLKPVAPDRLMQALRLVASRGPGAELQPLAEKLESATDFDTMVGAAPAFRTALAKAAVAARGHGNALIEGEGGTGKDMLARAMHAASPRANLPFNILNVRSVVPNALESVLFGHEKGAFPGAVSRQVGAFERCHGGTLVLDEINRLPHEVQGRLADAIERRRIQPVGAQYGFSVDVRVIAASNDPLANLVDRGLFDRSLHRLISRTKIKLPPLRERGGDLAVLARLFVGRIREQFGLPDLGLTDEALSLFFSYRWPGNVRQLQAVLLRAAALCRGNALTAADFPGLVEMAEQGGHAQGRGSQQAQAGVAFYTEDGNLRSLEAIEGDVVRLAIGHYQGRMTEVARRLRIGRSTLYRKLSELESEDERRALTN